MRVSAIEASQRAEHLKSRFERLAAREAEPRVRSVGLALRRSPRSHSLGIGAPRAHVSGRSGRRAKANGLTVWFRLKGLTPQGSVPFLDERGASDKKRGQSPLGTVPLKVKLGRIQPDRIDVEES